MKKIIFTMLTSFVSFGGPNDGANSVTASCTLRSRGVVYIGCVDCESNTGLCSGRKMRQIVVQRCNEIYGPQDVIASTPISWYFLDEVCQE